MSGRYNIVLSDVAKFALLVTPVSLFFAESLLYCLTHELQRAYAYHRRNTDILSALFVAQISGSASTTSSVSCAPVCPRSAAMQNQSKQISSKWFNLCLVVSNTTKTPITIDPVRPFSRQQREGPAHRTWLVLNPFGGQQNSLSWDLPEWVQLLSYVRT